MTPLAKRMADALADTSGFPFRQEAYRAGLEDAYKWLAEFPASRVFYRNGSGIRIQDMIPAIAMPGACIPVEDLNADMKFEELKAGELRAAMAAELRKVLWPGLIQESSATPDEKE